MAMLDLDGVVYIGPDAVPGAPEHLAAAPRRRDAARLRHQQRLAPARRRSPSTCASSAIAADDERRGHLAPRRRPGCSPSGARAGLAGVRDRRRGPVRGAGRAGAPAGAVDRGRARWPWCPASTRELSWGTVIDGAILVRGGLPWVASNTDLTRADAARARARATACSSRRSPGSPDRTPVVAGKPTAAAVRGDPAPRRRASARWSSGTGSTPTSRARSTPATTACW